jgi:hypothetical protein
MQQRTAPILPDASHRPSFEADLQALRERLVAEGMHGAQLEDVLAAARQMAAEPGRSAHVQAALRDPGALAERIRAVAARPSSFGAALASILLGVVTGLALAYAVLGNPWHSFPTDFPRWIAAIVGVVTLALLLAVTSRYTSPMVLGTMAGAAGGLAEVAVAAVPWLAIASTQPGCANQSACTVPPSVALGYGMVAALVYGVPLTVALAGLASIVGQWAQRAQLVGALRRAR